MNLKKERHAEEIIDIQNFNLNLVPVHLVIQG